MFQEIQTAIKNKDMGALGLALREAEVLDMEAELNEYRSVIRLLQLTQFTSSHSISNQHEHAQGSRCQLVLA